MRKSNSGPCLLEDKSSLYVHWIVVLSSETDDTRWYENWFTLSTFLQLL